MDKLFQKQLERSRLASGEVDLAKLGELVSEAYREAAQDRRRSDRSIELMIEELDELNRGLECEVNRQTAELRAKRAELEIQNSRFHAALEHMTHGLAMFDSNTRLVICNRRWRQMYSIPESEDLSGKPFIEIVEKISRGGSLPHRFSSPEAYVDYVFQQVKTGEASFGLLDLNDGRTFAVTWQPTQDGGWVSIHEDVTDRRRAEQRIAHIARHDALTNLPNRLLLLDRLKESLKEAGDRKYTAVLYLDLDRFKTINDTLGHPVGDALLKAVASRLWNCVKSRDTVARLGGDEFAIIQSRINNRNEASNLASRICGAINAPFDLDGHVIVADVSIGIAVAPGDGNEPNELLKNADLALHRAKAAGRGTFRFFEKAMDDNMKARRALEVDLRQALEKQQFSLAYQPIVNLAQNRVSSCEALLRWLHPERGLVSPAEFIPVAEEIGLITDIGEWVLRQALADAATWPESIKVSINVSPTQLTSGKMVPLLIDVLRETQVVPERVEIEITEEMLVLNPDASQKTLQQLRKVGTRIALDDFGTGYSSLIYLCRFPFDKIKIDRSFVKSLPEHEPAAIIAAITSLARSLDMITTAEGVETETQLKQVQALGCTEIQGYLVSKPVSAEEIHRMLYPKGSRQVATAS